MTIMYADFTYCDVRFTQIGLFQIPFSGREAEAISEEILNIISSSVVSEGPRALNLKDQCLLWISQFINRSLTIKKPVDLNLIKDVFLYIDKSKKHEISLLGWDHWNLGIGELIQRSQRHHETK